MIGKPIGGKGAALKVIAISQQVPRSPSPTDVLHDPGRGLAPSQWETAISDLCGELGSIPGRRNFKRGPRRRSRWQAGAQARLSYARIRAVPAFCGLAYER
jgi:hypothetical protein